MNIKKIDIGGFGKLEGKSYEFDNGLNIVYAPNESGKSTLAAFIKFALYGFAKKERTSDKNPVTSKLKYIPWSGTQASGALTCTHNGRDYVVARQVRKSSQMVSVNDAVTGENIPMRAEPGEEFFGIGLDTFESTAYFSQGAFSDMKMDELESKLKNMATGGDESVSYEKASAKLKQLLNRINTPRPTSKGGALNIKKQELQSRLASLGTQSVPDVSGISAGQRRLEQLENLVLSQREKVSFLENALKDAKNKTESERKTQFRNASTEYETIYEKYHGLTREKLNKYTMLYYKYIGIYSGFDAPPEKPENKKIWLPLAISGIVLLAAGCLMLILKLLLYGLIAAGLGTVLTLIGIILFFTSNSAYNKAVEKYNSDIKAYNESKKALDDVNEFISAYGCQKLPESFDILNGILEELTEKRTQLENLKAITDGGVQLDNGELLKETQYLRSLESEQSSLRVRLAEGREAINAALSRRDEAEKLEEQIKEINEEIYQCEADARIVNAAYSALEKAHDEMTHLFAPALNKKAESNMHLFTGGKRTLTIDGQGNVKIGENGVIRSLSWYSAGTADAAYISVRLACMDLIYEKDPPPLIFDDTFCNLDEDRMISMLKMLDGTGAQVIYFTCRNPRPFLNGVSCNIIEM